MTGTVASLTVIGLGNVLRGDDGVGIHVVEGLHVAADRDPGLLPERALLIDGGTLGLDLLRTIREAAAVVFVDAARLGAAPGTVGVLRGEELAAAAHPPAGGPVGALGELVATARLLGWLPGDVSLVAVEAGDVEPGVALSPRVAAALGTAIDAVIAELWRMDARPTDDAPGPRVATRMAGATA